MSFQIIGTGSYVPERVVTNDDLTQFVDTNDEWIRQRVGVVERHISVDETTADLGFHAAERALEAAGLTPADLDLILCATATADSFCPSMGSRIQQFLGATCPAFDLNSACSGFVFALETADAYLSTGRYQKILVVGAERMSRMLNWSDRSTCVIFGDGSGAAVLTPGEQLKGSHLYTQGGGEVLLIPAGQGNSPYFTSEIGDYQLNMNGQETFKFAVRRMEEEVRTVCEQAGITPADVKWIVPHQANTRIIDLCARRLKLPMERFCVNIQRYGNTSSASVAISLDELVRSGKLERGDYIVLCAFGGGLSSAGCIIKW